MQDALDRVVSLGSHFAFSLRAQNCVLVGWSAYLSHLNHSDADFVETAKELHTHVVGVEEDGASIVTPAEEVKVSIVRRATAERLKKASKTDT